MWYVNTIGELGTFLARENAAATNSMPASRQSLVDVAPPANGKPLPSASS
jgi:hypothetical protein